MSLPKKIPHRIIIYSKDIENITGRNSRTARRFIKNIRLATGKTNQQPITIYDFCIYTGMDEELVKDYLVD
jgi:hypothetical protein